MQRSLLLLGVLSTTILGRFICLALPLSGGPGVQAQIEALESELYKYEAILETHDHSGHMDGTPTCAELSANLQVQDAGCLNSGVCEAGPDSLSEHPCQCRSGYNSTDFCRTWKQDSQCGNGCGGHGECQAACGTGGCAPGNPDRGWACVCHSGFSGRWCEIETPDSLGLTTLDPANVNFDSMRAEVKSYFALGGFDGFCDGDQPQASIEGQYFRIREKDGSYDGHSYDPMQLGGHFLTGIKPPGIEPGNTHRERDLSAQTYSYLRAKLVSEGRQLDDARRAEYTDVYWRFEKSDRSSAKWVCPSTGFKWRTNCNDGWTSPEGAYKPNWCRNKRADEGGPSIRTHQCPTTRPYLCKDLNSKGELKCGKSLKSCDKHGGLHPLCTDETYVAINRGTGERVPDVMLKCDAASRSFHVVFDRVAQDFDSISNHVITSSYYEEAQSGSISDESYKISGLEKAKNGDAFTPSLKVEWFMEVDPDIMWWSQDVKYDQARTGILASNDMTLAMYAADTIATYERVKPFIAPHVFLAAYMAQKSFAIINPPLLAAVTTIGLGIIDVAFMPAETPVEQIVDEKIDELRQELVEHFNEALSDQHVAINVEDGAEAIARGRRYYVEAYRAELEYWFADAQKQCSVRSEYAGRSLWHPNVVCERQRLFTGLQARAHSLLDASQREFDNALDELAPSKTGASHESQVRLGRASWKVLASLAMEGMAVDRQRLRLEGFLSGLQEEHSPNSTAQVTQGDMNTCSALFDNSNFRFQLIQGAKRRRQVADETKAMLIDAAKEEAEDDGRSDKSKEELIWDLENVVYNTDQFPTEGMLSSVAKFACATARCEGRVYPNDGYSCQSTLDVSSWDAYRQLE